MLPEISKHEGLTGRNYYDEYVAPFAEPRANGFRNWDEEYAAQDAAEAYWKAAEANWAEWDALEAQAQDDEWEWRAREAERRER